jgi:hypothetical protein
MNQAEIHEQVSRILRSQAFASKGQLRKLLEILDRNIESQGNLNPSGVIQELWPDEIRTKRSTDVATEMNRLRRALDVYYREEGKSDPVTISLPNRSVAASNGEQEKRWILAKPRDGRETAEELRPAPTVFRRKTGAIAARIAAVVVVVAAAGYAGYHFLAGHDEPGSARLEGSSLVVMDGRGKELWRKSFAQGFGPDTYYTRGVESRIWFADLEGKGRTSVLFSYLPAADAQPHASTLICYSDRGREKWRWTPGRALPELGWGVPAFKTYSVGVLKATKERSVRIVVVSDLDPSWAGPSQVAVLDSSGKFLSEYWHSGGLRDMVVADLSGGGQPEIFLTGVAYGYDDLATLVALDPGRVSGASKEARADNQIHGMGEAQEKLRLLFPRSDLNRASFDHNIAVLPTVKDGKLRITVEECLAPLGCPVTYEFNRNFELIAAHPGNDEFQTTHDRVFQSGKAAHRFGAEDEAAFLKVRCLVGCKSELVPAAETFDPATSFEAGWMKRANPNDVWSYGYSAGFTEPITLYDKTVQNGINGPSAQYWLSQTENYRTSPSVAFINGPAFNDGNSNLLAHEFDLVAGVRGQYSDLIFTAPGGGEYSIEGNFRGAQYGVGTVIGIVATGTEVFRSRVTSVEQMVPFDLTENLRAGEKVVFSAGPGGGLQNTGLKVTITRLCGETDQPTLASSGEIVCSKQRQ